MASYFFELSASSSAAGLSVVFYFDTGFFPSLSGKSKGLETNSEGKNCLENYLENCLEFPYTRKMWKS